MCFGDSGTEPVIHRGGGKKKGGKGRIPRSVEDVTRYHQQILPQGPRMNRPINSDDDRKENDER